MRTTDAMRAVVVEQPGGPEVMCLRELPRPVPGPRQLLVRVHASALNRMDLVQRAGGYQAPASAASPLMGVEVAGVVEAVGVDVRAFERGARVFGLVDGGGYAEACLMEEGMAVRVPDDWSFVEAAATPEAFCAAHESLLELGGLREGQSVFVHAGGSGMGTACIQVARAVGARVFVSVGTEDKRRRCVALGAEAGVLRGEDFSAAVAGWTRGVGVDVVEDFIGGSAMARNLASLKEGGSLVLVGALDGMWADLDLKQVILRRLQIKGIALRPMSQPMKEAVTGRFRERWLPELVAGRVRPIVDSVFPLEQVADAHRRLESNQTFGKVVLTL
ncbi:NAD(P)H-quinone oxidoreductase [Myxococcus sp. K15C18031901]|uniref:NAD(P)H-quinone oxidoreductase n=1 Tax=Myxococcus dinghuensis TaxID=2906761 RepID=UPI0020A755B9|nr:NAD(P)H-quinone oxidoreductase [Myxococcus dinghuensis]MCP3099459.1 NAD(P)H-quinone oxidoreductase [Myxococcus dinghuensis]